MVLGQRGIRPRKDGTNETGTTAAEGGIECLLNAVQGDMSFPTTQKFLNDPNVWIGNRGASVHMTPHKTRIMDLKNAGFRDAITMGNGNTEMAS